MFGEKAQKKTFGRIFSLLDDSRDNNAESRIIRK